MLPFEQSGAFEGQFGFGVADGHFDLPTAGIRQGDLPGQLWRVSRLVGEQIPGRLSFSTYDNQPERLVVGWICNGESNNACFTFAATTGIPQVAMLPGMFSLAELTGFAYLSKFVHKRVILRPAQDEASAMQESLGQPGVTSITAIPDMQHFFAPYPVNVAQDILFCISFLALCFAPGDPPAHVRQRGSSFAPNHQDL